MFIIGVGVLISKIIIFIISSKLIHVHAFYDSLNLGIGSKACWDFFLGFLCYIGQQV